MTDENSWYVCRAPLDRCRAPGGGRLGLPFVCPLDHIFKPANFADRPALHGPPLFVREHSFLENPNVPTSVFVSPPHPCLCHGSLHASVMPCQACRRAVRHL